MTEEYEIVEFIYLDHQQNLRDRLIPLQKIYFRIGNWHRPAVPHIVESNIIQLRYKSLLIAR